MLYKMNIPDESAFIIGWLQTTIVASNSSVLTLFSPLSVSPFTQKEFAGTGFDE